MLWMKWICHDPEFDSNSFFVNLWIYMSTPRFDPFLMSAYVMRAFLGIDKIEEKNGK